MIANRLISILTEENAKWFGADIQMANRLIPILTPQAFPNS
ncbi:hypothetical protein B4065_2113 [Caldibacillus thermoamylovorans]|nr:hypothetical protein B4065_2113 [Caldibacillus thermoamylovorans]